ncbi:hypothetical protein TNCV_172611 [Trichonephila clavipes]|nr:hypothetical protein TNCV_172611 [Trichonephila clavipes]
MFIADRELDTPALNSHRVASPIAKLVERGTEVGGHCSPPKVFSLKIGGGTEPNRVLSSACSSKLRITTGVNLAPCRDEFREGFSSSRSQQK